MPIKRTHQVAAVMVNPKEILEIEKASNRRMENRKVSESVEVKVRLETNPKQPIHRIRIIALVEGKVNRLLGGMKEPVNQRKP